MTDKDSFLKALTPRNNVVNFSFTGMNLAKQKNTFSNFINSSNKTFSTFLNLEDNNNHTDIRQETSLVVKRINLKESKNNYYSKALKNIFFNPKYYLQNYYKGKKVIIGKEHHFALKENKDSSDFQRQTKKRKTINTSKNLSKSSIILLQKSVRNSKSFSSTKFQELENSSRSNRSKKELIKYPLSDNELKIIYKEIAEREKVNKNKKIDFLLNQELRLNVIPMINLQEKILKTKKKKAKWNQKLTKKIMNITFKERNDILMNQKKELLIVKKKQVDKELTKYSIFNKKLNDKTKTWIYNLRKDNNNNDNNEKQKCLIPSKKDTKEFVYYNKDLFAISPIHDIKKIFYKKINKDFNKAKKIRKNKTLIDLNSFHDLFIQGKNLLNQEIKLNKELIGKKKKLLHYNFNQNEISSILLAQSNPMDTMTTPKAVINSMEIHKFQ